MSCFVIPGSTQIRGEQNRKATKKSKGIASAANRTRGPSMATMDFTTKPLTPNLLLIMITVALISTPRQPTCSIPTAVGQLHRPFKPTIPIWTEHDKSESLAGCHYSIKKPFEHACIIPSHGVFVSTEQSTLNTRPARKRI